MNTNDRLARLEAALKITSCPTCREWPLFEESACDDTACGGSPPAPRHYPEQCPDCGKPGPCRMVYIVVPAREAV